MREGFEDYKTGKTDWIKGIQANGDTLTIKLTAPYVSFVDLMCQVAPLPKHIYENCAFENNGFKTDPIWRTIPVNSGMFVIKEHVPGSYYILEAASPSTPSSPFTRWWPSPSWPSRRL